jgi:hypothetical protein
MEEGAETYRQIPPEMVALPPEQPSPEVDQLKTENALLRKELTEIKELLRTRPLVSDTTPRANASSSSQAGP